MVEYLGHNHQLIPRQIGDRFTDDGFRITVAIRLSGVDEVDALGESEAQGIDVIIL